MCDQGPDTYAELEIDRRKLLTARKARGLTVTGALHCVHYSTVREIMEEYQIQRMTRGRGDRDKIRAEYIHLVGEGTIQDPRNLWLRKLKPGTGEIIISNPSEDPWNLEILLDLPDGAEPVYPGPMAMMRHVGYVVTHRSRDRDFSHQQALQAAVSDLERAISYILAWMQSQTVRNTDERTLQLRTNIRLEGMPTEMLDRSYNLQRMLSHGVGEEILENYRSYQPFYDMGIAPPIHQEMADIIIKRHGKPSR